MTGTFSGSHFDAEIAASDHDSVGSFENFFEMVDGLRLFEFGDDGQVAVVGGDDLFDHADVGGGADERKRDGVDAVGEAEFQVFAIFFGEGGNRQGDARKIDAFVLAEQAAVDNVAEHVFAADGAHTHFDQAVTEEDASAGREFAGQVGERGADARGCAQCLLRRNSHDRAGLQHHGLVAIERSGADFRALQVLENADGAAFALGGAAQALDVAGVVFVSAVREVEASDVHAAAEQVAHDGLGAAGGADGADDFRAAGGGGRNSCGG